MDTFELVGVLRVLRIGKSWSRSKTYDAYGVSKNNDHRKLELGLQELADDISHQQSGAKNIPLSNT